MPNAGAEMPRGIPDCGRPVPRRRRLRTKEQAEQHRLEERARYWADPERIRKVRREKREIWQRGIAKRRSAPGTLSAREKSLIKRDPCAYCGAVAQQIDHCIPISRGGWNDSLNCVASCARCNYAKGSQSVLEFLGLWPTGST